MIQQIMQRFLEGIKFGKMQLKETDTSEDKTSKNVNGEAEENKYVEVDDKLLSKKVSNMSETQKKLLSITSQIGDIEKSLIELLNEKTVHEDEIKYITDQLNQLGNNSDEDAISQRTLLSNQIKTLQNEIAQIDKKMNELEKKLSNLSLKKDELIDGTKEQVNKKMSENPSKPSINRQEYK